MSIFHGDSLVNFVDVLPQRLLGVLIDSFSTLGVNLSQFGVLVVLFPQVFLLDGTEMSEKLGRAAGPDLPRRHGDASRDVCTGGHHGAVLQDRAAGHGRVGPHVDVVPDGARVQRTVYF